MANQTIEQAKPLLPPSLFFAPQIREDGSFILRPDPKYRHEHYLASQGLTKKQIDPIINAHDESNDFSPPFLQEWYTEEINRKANILENAHLKLLAMDEISSRENKFRNPWTRQLILELFPQLNVVTDTEKELELFNGKRIEEFVDEDAIPLAKGYIEWIRNYMPDKIKPRLYPLHEISLAQHFMDYVRLFRGGTVILSSIPNEPSGEIFNENLDHETLNMLNLIYLATITKISEDPDKEKVFKAFHDSVSSAFKDIQNINLGVCLDFIGRKVSKINILGADQPLGDKDRKTKIWKLAYQIVQPYPARRFSNHNEGFVIFIEREKEFFAQMRKIQSGRFPLSDPIGARFVIVNYQQKADFINKLREKLPEWLFEKEPGETTSEESEWNEGEKYRVKWHNYPDFEFEMGIYWLRESRTKIGNWAQNLFGYKENFFRYRIDQLKKIIPILFPTRFSGIDWSSPSTIKMLYDHAHKKVLSSALMEFPD